MIRSGVVRASQTSSMGASKSRVRVTLWPSPAGIVLVPTSRPMASISRTMSIMASSLLSLRRWWGSSSWRREPPLALAASELRRKGIEALLPEPSEVAEPLVELAERWRVNRIQPAGASCPDRREPTVPEDLQVLRHRRLRDPELILDGGRDRPGRQLTFGQELQDPAPNGIAQDVERVHRDRLYKVRLILVKPNASRVPPVAVAVARALRAGSRASSSSRSARGRSGRRPPGRSGPDAHPG